MNKVAEGLILTTRDEIVFLVAETTAPKKMTFLSTLRRI